MTRNAGKHKPTIRDMFQLPMVGGGRISPRGDKVLYRIGYWNFKDNQFEVYSYLYDAHADRTFGFTKTGTVSEIRWLNNQSLALLKAADHNDFQIYVFEELMGEGRQITDHPGGIRTFEPFGNGFIYIAERKPEQQIARENRYGTFVDVEEEESLSALYYVDVKQILDQWPSLQPNTEKDQETKPVVELSTMLPHSCKIESAFPSPTDDAVFINTRSKDDLFYENDTSCFKIEFDPQSVFMDSDERSSPLGKVTRLALPKGARIQAVSPDGRRLLVSHGERGLGDSVQLDLWLLDLLSSQGSLESPELSKQLVGITRNLDREPQRVFWTKLGIFVRYWNESTGAIAKLTESGEVHLCGTSNLSPEYFFVNDDGHVFLRAGSPTSVAEIYYGPPKGDGWDLKRITRYNEVVADWDLGSVESIKWKSRDGTEIEGILRKPSDFDPTKEYPLLFYVHGGPASVSPCILLDNNNRCFYPTVQLLNKQILILEPNYRGSLGKGQSFRKLNFDNLGIGDLWDLESAIDHLVAEGYVDDTKIGSMGWSQGGYISAFVAMHSTRFKAVSAGAALCSWRTYYSGSDARHSILLSGDPYSNKEGFDKAAPISAIAQAKTPMLFQHGEKDPRVPVISAMEMYRALKARGIQTRLIVFPGQGHGVLKPRENYAIMVQNYRWFVHHLLGEELDLFMNDEGETVEIGK
ncbi:MAG: prolyl oligopeptidase family serine peptidase [Candidatus Bathyarchaeota archaeon]|nr:prolyl oligopeptidase family serine peptidase [Candidatus Bathyarchaeota archaeon]